MTDAADRRPDADDGPLRVAIVEDSIDVQAVLELMVRDDTTHVVALAPTVTVAYSLDWRRIDVALVDRHLPDGLTDDLVRWLRGHYPHLRVVMLTADDPWAVPEDLRDVYLGKPVDLGTLRGRVRGGA